MRRFAFSLCIALTFASILPAQDPVDEAQPAEKPAEKPAEVKKAPDLHKIYVPFDKLDKVFGTDKERVMVPYKEFLELWKLKYGPKESPDKAPLPFTVESARYTGHVRDGLAIFEATLAIEIFEKGWQRIPLAFSGVAFDEVRVDDKPGVLIPTKKGYELILRGEGRHTIKTRFVAGIARGKEFATTAFGLPAVPLHRLSFRVAGRDTEMKIEPARAHSTTNEGDDTVLLAFLGPQGNVKITWRSKPEEKDVEPSLVFATDLIDVRVEERIVRGWAQFDLEVLRTAANSFEFGVPEGLQVLEVTGANIRTWGFADEARRRLQVSMHKPVLGKTSIKVGFEGPVTVPGDLKAPAFRVANSARERGWMRISGAEGVGVRPLSEENVFQVDLNALPQPIRGGQHALGFRFPAHPFALSLRTERIEPRVTLLTRARLEVERRQIKLHTDLQFTVERAGIFSVTIEVPADVVLTDIGDPKLVDNWRETKEEGKPRLLTLELRGRRIGKFRVPIKAVRALDLAQGSLPVPLLKVLNVDREEGTLGVYMDPGIEATADTKGVVPVEIAKLAREDRFGSKLPLRFGWRWRGGTAEATFKVEARKPKVTANVLVGLQAEENKVRYAAELAYSVEYTGVEQVRFRVPKRVSESLKLEESYEVKKDDDKVEAGEEPTVTYTVLLGGPILGPVKLKLRYDEKFPAALKVNEKRTVPIPALVPLDVHTTTCFVAIRKAPVLKIDAPTDVYEQIDASELPGSLRTDDVFLALRRFDSPAKFPLVLEKHAYQPVADLVVRHVHLKTVLNGENDATTTAYMEILNNDRQFLAIRLPDGNKVLELWVGDEVKKPRLGEGGVILVELKTGLPKDETFRVAVVYTHPISDRAGTTIRGPVLPAYEDQTAPFQALLTWSVIFPGSWEITGFDGNVEPTRAETEPRSWLFRSVAALGGLIRPAAGPGGSRPAKARRLPQYEDIVPVHIESGSREIIFTNGVGDGELTIHHRSGAAQILYTLLAAAIGIGVLVGITRAFKPLPSGGAIALVALLLLAFASYGWIAVFNGLLAGVVFATIALWIRERRRARA
ncbi:MAG: hypothetical protein ACYTGZ_15960 [Planctomycetota bacterium]|jgi:hypothetical protein